MEMRLKEAGKYLICLIILSILIFAREYFSRQYLEYHYRFVVDKMVYYEVLCLLSSVSIGLILGLKPYLREYKLPGRWKVDVLKLLILGIPSFYFSILILLFNTRNALIFKLIEIPLYFTSYSLEYVTIFQIIFGYLIATSFYKVSNISSE